MKAIIYLLIQKQWKTWLLFIILLSLVITAVHISEQQMTRLFKMPIAVQDLDQTPSSEAVIKQLESNKSLSIYILKDDNQYIEDEITKKKAVVSLQIPKGYSEALRTNQLKSRIPLYYRADFIGSIAEESISRVFYEMQIPFIVKKHLDRARQHITQDKINHTYMNNIPTSELKTRAITKRADQSLSAGIYFSVFLFMSCIQVFLNRRLNQTALTRMMYFPGIKLKWYITYIISHSIVLLFIFWSAMNVINQQLSLLFYLNALLFTVIIECGLSMLLFNIKTLSHRYFMTLSYSALVAAIYIMTQL